MLKRGEGSLPGKRRSRASALLFGLVFDYFFVAAR